MIVYSFDTIKKNKCKLIALNEVTKFIHSFKFNDNHNSVLREWPQEDEFKDPKTHLQNSISKTVAENLVYEPVI